MESTRPIGRFAPTPSGDMHFGNLLCALVSYLSVKSRGGEFIVRIEDLDTLRAPRANAEKILYTLEKFGLHSDRPPVFQSERTALYKAAEEKLARLGLTYPCFCSRAELHAAKAPRLDDGGVIYPGTCRHIDPERLEILQKSRKPCTRLAVTDEVIRFTDGIAGEYEQNLKEKSGDFIIKRSDSVYAYQLAVAVDDCKQGVTEVVRGDDLLSSTPRQIYIMRLLGYSPPEYFHIPLVTDFSGRKLSKSEGDRIAEKAATLEKERILGALAYAAGIIDKDEPASTDELISEFSFDKLKRRAIFLPKILCE